MRSFGLVATLLALSAFAPMGKPITVFLAGDSTMAPKLAERRPETGWGEHLQKYFDSTRVRIDNHARNGRSTRSFIEEGSWQRLIDRVDAGDYVLIQFGHNDAARDRVDRYTSPDDYRRNLSRFITEVRARRATPVLLTPVMRRRFDEHGRFYDAHGEYPDIVRRVAADSQVHLIDMHQWSGTVLREYGPERSKALFLHLRPGEHPNYPQGLADNTHFSPTGAAIMADLAIAGIRELRPGLADHVIARGPWPAPGQRDGRVSGEGASRGAR